MSGVSIKFSGLNELDKALNRLPQELKTKAYRSVLSTGARVIAKNARKRVPEVEGLLKKSIGIKVNVKATTPHAFIGSKSGVTGVVDGRKISATHYSKNVEQGTAHTAAQPFIRPAIDESEVEVMNKMSKGLNRFMERAITKLKTKGKF
tara:strand:- start:23 stop:469 length:447 start_codon:yes stop_codon:yes gene_type:complete